MATKQRRADAARARGRSLTEMVLRELRDGRADRNVSGSLVAKELGRSHASYSRLERGVASGLTIEDATVALAAVGLELSVRVYPGGAPIRDTAHAGVIARICSVCHRTIKVLTEVPMPGTADQRAWDVVLVGPGWRHACEVETRPRDLQALERRIALKTRDSGIEGVSLVLLDSRHNRDFVAVHADALALRFPEPPSVAIASLRAGVDPGQGSIILI